MSGDQPLNAQQIAMVQVELKRAIVAMNLRQWAMEKAIAVAADHHELTTPASIAALATTIYTFVTGT